MFYANPVIDTDSYKFSHYLQYPEGMEYNYSYFESRGGDYNHTVFFGLQYLLHELAKPITKEMVDEAEALANAHGFADFNREGWDIIVNEYNGKLPIRIKAVPEGSVVPYRNVLTTVENTDPRLGWLTSYVETKLARLWYPCTVATRSWTCRRIIEGFLNKTSDNPEAEIPFKLHDFGSRGVSSLETAAIGGAAHLVNFLGTDTVVALQFLQKYYGAEMPGFSIPAAEHSTMSPYGRDGEADAYRNMLEKFGDGNLVAVVSDTWDIYNAAENIWGEQLKSEVEAANALVVIRPDSGDPVEVVTKLIQILDEKFGSATNTKGYKVLNNVRIIQGDGMDQDQIRVVYWHITNMGYAADNLAVGMGAGLLQKLNRDTCKFAYKTSWMQINGKSVDVYKDPVTDKGKKSKKGRLSLISRNGHYETVPEQDYGDELEVVFENGEIKKTQTLEEIRERAANVRWI